MLEALADEIAHMLDEGVVASAAEVDACLILGAGYPFFLGGITKHLDQTRHLRAHERSQVRPADGRIVPRQPETLARACDVQPGELCFVTGDACRRRTGEACWILE